MLSGWLGALPAARERGMDMKWRKIRRSLAFGLAFLLVFSGCGKVEETGEQPAMGRYIEEKDRMPENLDLVLGMDVLSDGTQVLAAIEQQQLRLFEREKDGQWSSTVTLSPEEFGDLQPESICWNDQGEVLVVGTVYPMEDSGETFSDDVSLKQPELRGIWLDSSGQKTAQSFETSESLISGTFRQLATGPKGNILGSDYTEVYHFDGTGALKNRWSMERQVEGIAVWGDKAAVALSNEIRLYDLNTGEQGEVFPLPEVRSSEEEFSISGGLFKVLLSVGEDGALYVCSAQGIFRIAGDGALIEQLADGSLTSLGDPSAQLVDFIVDGDVFQVMLLNSSSEYQLLQYRYDPQTATVPAKELRIYGLTENRTIRLAISEYQRQNPDTQVIYETAGEDVSLSDAIRSLNTRLLAGEGPDLLMLDGLPVDSYVEKGVLLDLRELAEKRTASGEWLTPVIQGMKEANGSLYALPARFGVPMVIGDGDLLEQAEDLTALEQAGEDLSKRYPNAMVLYDCGGKQLTQLFFPWYLAQGSGEISREVLTALLTDMEGWRQLQKKENPDLTPELLFGALAWRFNTDILAIGDVVSPEDLAMAWQALGEKEGGVFLPLPAGGKKLFTPMVQLGVNASGKATEEALNFVETVLSLPVQQEDFREGLPVNQEAWQTMTEKLSAREQLGGYGFTDEGGETKVMIIAAPRLEQWESFWSQLQTLDTAVQKDQLVMEQVTETADRFFQGSVSLEEGVEELTAKLSLMASE